MASRRVERVRSLLKREIGEAIRRELPVGEAGLITVNDVAIGGDLRNARVFISILGGPEQQKSGLALLEKNRVRLQGIVAKKGRRVAQINNETLSPGQSAKVRIASGEVSIRCLEIRDASVIVRVEGRKEPLELRLAQRL